MYSLQCENIRGAVGRMWCSCVISCRAPCRPTRALFAPCHQWIWGKRHQKTKRRMVMMVLVMCCHRIVQLKAFGYSPLLNFWIKVPGHQVLSGCIYFKHFSICSDLSPYAFWDPSFQYRLFYAYLIFVIFFTQAKFLENKIYTEIYTVNCQFTQ